jgi:hypothetical protein
MGSFPLRRCVKSRTSEVNADALKEWGTKKAVASRWEATAL